MNLPNKITLSRILLVPVFLYFLLNNFSVDSPNYVALIIFILASITDFLDGYLARKLNLVSKLGKFMDPLADKLLVAAALIGFVQTDQISSYFVFIIISRELIISVFRAVAASEGVVISASIWGKIKTNTQILAIIMLLLNNAPFNGLNIRIDMITLYIATIATVISGIDYIYKNRNVLN
ncbi:CDP-diacylglycerol--glycerol-3-phosphate 3-phosphatidyltransferase [Helicovermis profundi]|uniref:CDP-diacylglycerol--glycerol-3-phosphate 3-phosphatidyltransferase n=1 Tax=Helicovermis profundi TaxID=3065157 RepID=A0AAU9EEZ4_9FIRM|nr:CDP-diacylglycerol--glycerol-3-phosphate 3-phosphatidyltransferase [Clostridia bacterium S502]